MTPHERFVHFVDLFLGHKVLLNAETKRVIIEEAFGLNLDALYAEPMQRAYEFVEYRATGANRPAWFPKRQPVTKGTKS